jgi:hypothetical protein
MVWYGVVWYGMVAGWYGMGWDDMGWDGTDRIGVVACFKKTLLTD